MKRRKLNWNNLFLLITLIFSSSVIVYDFCIFTIRMLLGKTTAYTWIGFVTYGLCWMMIIYSYEELKEITNKKRNKVR